MDNVITIFFYLFYYGFFFSKWSFKLSNHKEFLKSFIFGGCLILLLSLIIFLIGKILNLENKLNFYYVSLELNHFVQSSLYPISFLLVFCEQQNKNLGIIINLFIKQKHMFKDPNRIFNSSRISKTNRRNRIDCLRELCE